MKHCRVRCASSHAPLLAPLTSQALYDLSDNLVEVLGATAAGVALVDGEGLRFVTATSDKGDQAERVQERLQDGPCLESIVKNTPGVVADLRDCHGRWPGYAPAVEKIGRPSSCCTH